MAGAEIERLIQLLAKLPGLGPRSARRAALHMVKQKDRTMAPLARALSEAVEKVAACSACGNVDTADPCGICTDPRRDPAVLCVVEEVGDLWAMERAAIFRGRYHVLGGALSALDGVGPDELRIPALVRRASEPAVTEVVLATNATVEGQTTGHYIADRLADAGVTVTALAHGVPVGGELDYLDDGTLSAAMKARRAL
ncbi:MAG: recombination protein RecR [Rhodospirillaceae bacterium]|nr:recombination mediator RecR [Rhodospirillaceae bacterium]MCY4065892.1 recombination mediator RecR [Rhodospirillaceae bacterium]MDE0703936.1 recombination mediator RecR [Rhodospirillaceae bacterium]MXW91409.1 recombination protein RecR [Rhodospirillaceae bacterium]MYB13190.1 recombination protein RecR [Rhodospirillaceae bacterium]